jgi:hypothetical protein
LNALERGAASEQARVNDKHKKLLCSQLNAPAMMRLKIMISNIEWYTLMAITSASAFLMDFMAGASG